MLMDRGTDVCYIDGTRVVVNCVLICIQMDLFKFEYSANLWFDWHGGRSSAGRALDCDSFPFFYYQ